MEAAACSDKTSRLPMPVRVLRVPRASCTGKAEAECREESLSPPHMCRGSTSQAQGTTVVGGQGRREVDERGGGGGAGACPAAACFTQGFSPNSASKHGYPHPLSFQ
eukprot:scaffold207_cov409-Prasinococcus_capsulatus_cf.AAC.6